MSAISQLKDIRPTQVWGDVIARVVHGERITLSVVELTPGGVVPEHHHGNEQVGICVQGSLTWRIGSETREIGPGGIWRITADVPHEVTAGPSGAVVVETFSPIRSDWDALPAASEAVPRWP